MNDEAARLNTLTEQIIGAAMNVHRTLGPGLLESAYEACLYYELVRGGMKVERQKPLPLSYGDVRLECSYRMDLVVDSAVIVEVKSVEAIGRVHEAQMDSYLKIGDFRVGLILNFNVRTLSFGGIKRRVNGFPE